MKRPTPYRTAAIRMLQEAVRMGSFYQLQLDRANFDGNPEAIRLAARGLNAYFLIAVIGGGRLKETKRGRRDMEEVVREESVSERFTQQFYENSLITDTKTKKSA